MAKACLKTKKTRIRKKSKFTFEDHKRYRIKWTNLTRQITTTGMVLPMKQAKDKRFVCIHDDKLTAPFIVLIDNIIDSKQL